MRKRIWSEYNKKLVQRGSVTFCLDEKTVRAIRNFRPKSTGGRPQEYPKALIELLVLIKIQFRLTYRALEGFAKSIFQRIKRCFRIPTYSTICKRAKELLLALPSLTSTQSKVILLDASGIQVFGEGEWKRKVHGVGRPRKWLKLHIALDEQTQEVVAEVLTGSRTADCTMVETLLHELPPNITTVKADGAYDGIATREIIHDKGATALIPPPKNAAIKKQSEERNTATLQILGFGGDERARSLWGRLTGYSRRALVETAFSRYKRLFGGRLFSRTESRQIVENRYKWYLLNRMITS